MREFRQVEVTSVTFTKSKPRLVRSAIFMLFVFWPLVIGTQIGALMILGIYFEPIYNLLFGVAAAAITFIANYLQTLIYFEEKGSERSYRKVRRLAIYYWCVPVAGLIGTLLTLSFGIQLNWISLLLSVGSFIVVQMAISRFTYTEDEQVQNAVEQGRPLTPPTELFDRVRQKHKR